MRNRLSRQDQILIRKLLRKSKYWNKVVCAGPLWIVNGPYLGYDVDFYECGEPNEANSIRAYVKTKQTDYLRKIIKVFEEKNIRAGEIVRIG